MTSHLVEYAKELGAVEIKEPNVSEDTWVGNLQWDHAGAKFNLRVTGDEPTDKANMELLATLFTHAQGIEIVDEAKPRGGGGRPQGRGGGGRAPARQAPARQADCEWYRGDEGPMCPDGGAFKYVPGGNARVSGKPFPSFFSCTTSGHNTSVNESDYDDGG